MELRVGLGCMRLDPACAFDTIAAAVESRITVFDTARAYGDNERVVGEALRRVGATARIVTKGGMERPDGRWVPDGRAKSIVSDCERSLEALDGLPIDLYLLHAPDPRTPWRTSLRALTRLLDEGLVKRIGVCNVNRTQLDEALDIAPISAIQVALSFVDDRALRGGVVERCEDAGIALMAHSPLGGPRKAGALARNDTLSKIAAEKGVSPAEAALAWLLALSPVVVPIPGATRPETARSAAAAASVEVDVAAREQPKRTKRSGEVVVVMGIPGAGKSRMAEDFVSRNYVRMNRDERGGSLRDLAAALDRELESSAGSVVLDNTYLTRASRSYVIEAAHSHGVAARCVWIDIALPQAQVNMVQRLLDRFGSLPAPDELKGAARREPGLHTPTTQMRTLRELEPPSEDEGWDVVARVPFVRTGGSGSPAVFVAAAAVDRFESPNSAAPHLVFDWRPDETVESLAPLVDHVASVVSGRVAAALCPHGGGPPKCWCRPPLPGLPLAFARMHNVDPSGSLLVGCRPAHRTLAESIGAHYVDLAVPLARS